MVALFRGDEGRDREQRVTWPKTIDEYLDALAEEVVVAPRRLRRILIEVEDHLRARMTALQDTGLADTDAEQEAIRRFGEPSIVAQGFAPNSFVPSAALVHHLAISLLGIGAVGLLAIGLSGLLSLSIGKVAGKNYVAGTAEGVTYTPARCADFLEYHPEAPDCASAAVAHHFDEVVWYRVAAGSLGLVALGLYVIARRRWPRSRLPRIFAPTIGTALFGLAALGLLFLGITESFASSASGLAGAYLSGGIIASFVAAGYGVRLLPLLASESS
jgi:hypothetical protein